MSPISALVLNPWHLNKIIIIIIIIIIVVIIIIIITIIIIIIIVIMCESTFFDIRVCHPNADSYKDLTPEQVYRLHENEKKRMYERRILEVEQASFTPLVFTTTGGMGSECLRYHSRLAELISIKKGEDYAKTIKIWFYQRS